VPGGGVALLRAGAALDKLKADKKLTDDERTGVTIVSRAVKAPMHWIAQNAGEEGSIVVSKVGELKDMESGYNAANGTYENLVEAGVIDPTKVVRFALQNAASIAGLMLTTEALVSEIPEKKERGAPGPGGMPPGMDDY